MPKALRVHICTYKTTAKDERQRLKAFIQRHPHIYQGRIDTKIHCLQGYLDDRTVWGHYIGQTPSKRGLLAELH